MTRSSFGNLTGFVIPLGGDLSFTVGHTPSVTTNPLPSHPFELTQLLPHDTGSIWLCPRCKLTRVIRRDVDPCQVYYRARGATASTLAPPACGV